MLTLVQILTALVTVLQLTLIALWAATASYKSRASVASAVFSFLAYAALGLVSYFEHVYTIRPSFTITCFLFLAVLFDIARIRTLWLIGRDVSVAGVVSASFSLKVLLLVAESWEKTSLITKTDEAYSPEAISGSFNRWVFWWINQLMLLGYKTNVLMKDLFPVDDQMRSRLMQDRFQKEWKKGKRIWNGLQPQVPFRVWKYLLKSLLTSNSGPIQILLVMGSCPNSQMALHTRFLPKTV